VDIVLTIAAAVDVARNNPSINGRKLDHGRRLLIRANAYQGRGGPARDKGNDKHWDTRGFHNASPTSLPNTPASIGRLLFHLERLRGVGAERCWISTAKGQFMVK